LSEEKWATQKFLQKSGFDIKRAKRLSGSNYLKNPNFKRKRLAEKDTSNIEVFRSDIPPMLSNQQIG